MIRYPNGDFHPEENDLCIDCGKKNPEMYQEPDNFFICCDCFEQRLHPLSTEKLASESKKNLKFESKMKIDLCPCCEQETTICEIVEKTEYNILGKQIEIDDEFLRCTECQGEFDDSESDFDSIAEAYKKFEEFYGFNPTSKIRNRIKGTVTEIKKDTFSAVICCENTDEYYEFYKSSIKKQDLPFFTLGSRIYVDETGLRLSHEVWTEEQIKEINIEAQKLMKFLQIKK